jgi:hypothetical protein
VDIGAAHAEAAIEAGTVAHVEPAPAASQADAQADAQAAQFEAAIETAIADDTPPAEPTALVKALNEVSPKPASAAHPIASTVPLEAAEGQVALPPVTPPESIAPVIAPPPKASRSSRRK